VETGVEAANALPTLNAQKTIAVHTFSINFLTIQFSIPQQIQEVFNITLQLTNIP
jgi:hypothetical protein